VWIAVLGSVKLFPNLEAALKGVFNRVLSERERTLLPTEASLPTYSAAHVELNDDTGGALRAAARTGGALRAAARQARTRDRAVTACPPKPWHDRSPRRTATACGVPTRPPGQICHEGAQARTAALERAALMRIVKQVRATLGDALCLSLWADFVTHTNARYMDAIIRPFRRPIFRRPDRLIFTP